MDCLECTRVYKHHHGMETQPSHSPPGLSASTSVKQNDPIAILSNRMHVSNKAKATPAMEFIPGQQSPPPLAPAMHEVSNSPANQYGHVHSCYVLTQQDEQGTQPDGLKVPTQQVNPVFQQIINCLPEQYLRKVSHCQDKTCQQCLSPNQMTPESLLDICGGVERLQDNPDPAPPPKPVDNEWNALQHKHTANAISTIHQQVPVVLSFLQGLAQLPEQTRHTVVQGHHACHSPSHHQTIKPGWSR